MEVLGSVNKYSIFFGKLAKGMSIRSTKYSCLLNFLNMMMSYKGMDFLPFSKQSISTHAAIQHFGRPNLPTISTRAFNQPGPSCSKIISLGITLW